MNIGEADKAREIQDRASDIGYAVQAGDVLATLRNIDALNRAAIDLAWLVCERGAHDYTQTALATALGVTPRTLRGLKAEVAR